METEKRRWFVCGGTGFCGREIVRQLVKRDDTESVKLLTRDAQRAYHTLKLSPKISLYEGDITDCQFPTDEFTDVIHGANEANDLRQPDAHRYYYTIVEGTQRFMRWAWQQGFERITLLSSGAVSRDTVYGRAKRVSEWITTHLCPTASVARIYSVIGEEMPLAGQYAAGIFVHQALYDGKVTCRGGTSIRSYLHVEDVAQRILQMHGYAGAYDVCGSEAISIFALAREVAAVFDVPFENIEDVTVRKDVYIASSRVTPSITLTQALERIKNHYNKETAHHAA